LRSFFDAGLVRGKTFAYKEVRKAMVESNVPRAPLSLKKIQSWNGSEKQRRKKCMRIEYISGWGR
jgi:hypothetical protein